MRRIIFAIAPLGLVMSSPLAASSPKELTKKGANPDQIVCKVERFVGSNLKNRICKTRAEWKAVAEDTKQGMDDRWFKGQHPGDPAMGGPKGPGAGGPGN